FAPVASALRLAIINPNADAGYKDVPEKPILHVAGKTDPLVKFEWQQKTIELLRERNHCTEGKPWDADSHCTIYASPDNAPVIAYIHEGDYRCIVGRGIDRAV